MGSSREAEVETDGEVGLNLPRKAALVLEGSRAELECMAEELLFVKDE